MNNNMNNGYQGPNPNIPNNPAPNNMMPNNMPNPNNFNNINQPPINNNPNNFNNPIPNSNIPNNPAPNNMVPNNIPNPNMNMSNPNNMMPNNPQNVNPNLNGPMPPQQQPGVPSNQNPKEQSIPNKPPKEKKEVSTTTAVLVTMLMMLVIFGCIIYILYTLGYVSFNFGGTKPNQTETNNNNNNANPSYTEADYIRETSTVLMESSCSGSENDIVASIDNENITITGLENPINIEAVAPKYLYAVTKNNCNSFNLYYITENNELYMIDNTYLDDNTLAPSKVLKDNVTEFLGLHDENGKSYLNVLLSSGEAEKIVYYQDSDDSYTEDENNESNNNEDMDS